MFFLFLLTFYEDKRYCLVSDPRQKAGCKGYSDMIISSKMMTYTFTPSSNGMVEIFVHQSIQEYDHIEFTSKQLSKNSFHFTGNPFLFVFKENELIMNTLLFEANSMHMFMYCTPKSTFCIDTFKCFGELEFRDKVKKNLITIDNFTIKTLFQTSIIYFNSYDQLLSNPSCTLEIILEEKDKIGFDINSMLVSDIAVDINKYQHIILAAKKELMFNKITPLPITIPKMPDIIFDSNNALITFNSVWGVSPVITFQKGEIIAKTNLTIDFENIDDVTLNLYNIKAKNINRNLNKYGGNYCLFNSNLPNNDNCAFVRYVPGKAINYPLPSSLQSANFYIYDTFPNTAVIDANAYGGKSLNIIGSDMITKVAIDLSKGGPSCLSVEHCDLELRGSTLILENFTMKSDVILTFSEELPVFNITNFMCDCDTDFLDDCVFHCNNLILNSDRISLIDEFPENSVDYIIVYFLEKHQITELSFRVNTFQIQFQNIVFRTTNEQLEKMLFVLPYQQNREIRVKNFFPENYKMKYFPHILYLNDSSVNYNFDESWEENNVHVESKRGAFFHPTKNNYIHTKSDIKKLLEIFDLCNYVHSSKIYSTGYCISDDSSQCGPDQQVVPNSDKILSRIFLPDPYGDCMIKIVSSDVILDMHCFSGINVHLYSTSKKSITLLFRPNVIIPRLEITSLTTKFRTVDEMDLIIIGTLISDTSDIQTTDMNTPLEIRNLMRILAFAYINIVPFLTPSTTRRIELVSSDDYPPISSLIVGPDHFVFEMTSKYSVIANFSMFSTITYIHASQKSTKITIIPHNRFRSYLPKMPDFEFLSTSTYISFSEDWFELNPIVVHKGHVSTRHSYPAKIFTPRSVIPDIFIFDEKPIINFFSDRSICLYRTDESLCPKAYSPFKYTSRKISMKLLELYTRQLTLYVVESDQYDMPTIDEDVASLDKLTLISADTQYVAIHAEKVIKTLNLINTSVYIFSQANLPIYNLSMTGISNIISDTLDIHHATVTVECFNNAKEKFVQSTHVVIMDDLISTVFFGDDVVSINNIVINHTLYDYISITFLHTVIFSPLNKTYNSIKPILLDFTGNDPSVTFDKAWKQIPDSEQPNAIMRSDVSIKIFGVPHNGFYFEKEYTSSAAKMCVMGKKDVCPGGYTHITYTGEPLFLDDQIMQMELYIIPKTVVIHGESISRKRLKLFSNTPKTVKFTYCFTPPDLIDLENITLETDVNFTLDNLILRSLSSVSGGYDVQNLDIDWISRSALEKFKNNNIVNCTVKMPNEFDKMEMAPESYMIWIGNISYVFDYYNMKNIYFRTNSQFVNMSTSSEITMIKAVPSIIMNQGIIYFDGKWENVKCRTTGILKGMTEVIIDEIFPEHIFIIDPTITISILAQDVCLFNDLISSESCPKGAKQIKYSEYSIELFALPDVWVYVTDTTENTPLRIRSRCSYISFELYALGTMQDVVFSVQDVQHIAFSGITVIFSKESHYQSIRSDCAEIGEGSSHVIVDSLSMTGATNFLEMNELEAKNIEIVSSRFLAIYFSDSTTIFTDEFDNISSRIPPFSLIVNSPLTLDLAPINDKNLGRHLILPTQIILKDGAELNIENKLSSAQTDKKITLIKMSNSATINANGFDIRNNNLFDYEVIAQPPEELKVSNERLNNDEESDDAENENINDKTEGRDL